MGSSRIFNFPFNINFWGSIVEIFVYINYNKINKGERIKMVCGAIPYNNFKERMRIINELKKEFGKVRITVMDDVVVYEYRGKLKMNEI